MAVGKEELYLRHRGDIVALVNNHTYKMIVAALGESIISWRCFLRYRSRLFLLLSNHSSQVVVLCEIKFNKVLIFCIERVLLCIS